MASASLAGPQTMQSLADATGGEAFRTTNDIGAALKEVVSSTRYSYTLGFYPEAAGFDDRNHALKVTLAKKPETDKAKLMMRKDYLAWKTASPFPLAKMAMKDVMAQRSLEAGIALMGVANTDPNNPALTHLDIRVGIEDLQFTKQGDKWVAKTSLALGVDGQGMVGSEDFPIELTAEQWQEAMALGGVETRRSVETGVGKSGVLRIGVQDQATGNAGTMRLRYGAR
jgi:hypothetical protein